MALTVEQRYHQCKTKSEALERTQADQNARDFKQCTEETAQVVAHINELRASRQRMASQLNRCLTDRREWQNASKLDTVGRWFIIGGIIGLIGGKLS